MWRFWGRVPTPQKNPNSKLDRLLPVDYEFAAVRKPLKWLLGFTLIGSAIDQIVEI